MFTNRSLETHFDDVRSRRLQRALRKIDTLNNQRIDIETGVNSFGEYMSFRISATNFAREAIEKFLKTAGQEYKIYNGEVRFTQWRTHE